jgi:hypothetical protein
VEKIDVVITMSGIERKGEWVGERVGRVLDEGKSGRPAKYEGGAELWGGGKS